MNSQVSSEWKNLENPEVVCFSITLSDRNAVPNPFWSDDDRYVGFSLGANVLYGLGRRRTAEYFIGLHGALRGHKLFQISKITLFDVEKSNF
jgi:hypothetical protein